MQSPLKERTPMLGKKNPQQPLFYYFNMFNMADMIPKNHILRLINKLGLSPKFSEAFQKER